MIGGPIHESGTIVIEHPSGRIPVAVELSRDASGEARVARVEILRTARRIFEGHVFVPD